MIILLKHGRAYIYQDFKTAVANSDSGDMIFDTPSEETIAYTVPDYEKLDELEQEVKSMLPCSRARTYAEAKIKMMITDILRFEERLKK